MIETLSDNLKELSKIKRLIFLLGRSLKIAYNVEVLAIVPINEIINL